MKRAIIIVSATLLAYVTGASAVEPTPTEMCQDYYHFSENVMKMRQMGTPMPRVMGTAEGSRLLESIVQRAYRTPRYSAPSNQDGAVQDFANREFSSCLEAVQDLRVIQGN